MTDRPCWLVHDRRRARRCGGASRARWAGAAVVGAALAMGCSGTVSSAAPQTESACGVPLVTAANVHADAAVASVRPTTEPFAPADGPERVEDGDRAAGLPGVPGPMAAADPALELGSGGPRLPAEAIRRVVRWNIGRFRDCYQRALVTTPHLSGQLAVHFWIDSSGTAQDCEVLGTDLPEPVAACVAAAFAQLRFPAVEGGPIGVRYGFQLGPADSATEGRAPLPSTARANRPLPTARPGASTVASVDDPSRELFRLFLAGLTEGPKAGAEQPSARPVAATAQRPASSPPGPSANDSAGTPAPLAPQPGSCPPGDPLCSDI